MRKFHNLIHSLLLTTSPTLFAYPQHGHASPQQINVQEIPYFNFNLTYDEVLRLLADIEEGRIDDLSEEELEKISRFLAYLAQVGLLPGETAANFSLENDIAALFEEEEDEENFYEFAQYSDFSYAYMVLPALLNGGTEAMFQLCKHKHKHKHKHKKHKHKKNIVTQITDFVKKHKKAIIIGVAIIVAATALVIAVAAASSATAGAVATAAEAAAAAPAALAQSDKKESVSSPSVLTDMPPEMTEAIWTQLSSFKEKIAEHQFFESEDPTFWQQGLSWEENGRVLGSLLAHDSFNALQTQMFYYPELAPMSGDQGSYVGHPKIDNKFSTDYTHLFANPTQDIDFNALSLQVRGEAALSVGYYDQAIRDFGKAIEINPTNSIPYLERGIAHFNLGQYEHSLNDYERFTTQTQKANPLSISEFSLGFAKEFPKGIYESGEGMFLFLADFVTHPIQTSVQLVDATTALVDLMRTDQWGIIAEALSPEMHQLITQWETLSSKQKGELAGYALGKHGADFLAPSAIAAIAKRSVKCAQELAIIMKNFKIAQETLVLETAAGIGNTAKIAEVVEIGQRTARLGDELGFTAHEMGQLKQAGQLETTVKSTFEHLNLSMQESVKLFGEAKRALKPYQGIYMTESQARELIHATGIPTFPRPIGIPENYRIKLSDKPGGIKYIHPSHEQTYVRVMPGKLHAKYPQQQKPYVVQMKDGKTLDKFGNVVSYDSLEAHIPLEEFIYIE